MPHRGLLLNFLEIGVDHVVVTAAAAHIGAAHAFKKRWLTILSVILCILIGLSRVLLGVHYPTDILCGYFTANEKKDVKSLKKELKETLPYYMVPTALFQLEEFPLNMNRKIDRKAIKAPRELDDHKLLEKLY